MFKLHTLQAQFGDCLILEFGRATEPKFLLIDGGPPDTFRDVLDAEIMKIVSNRKLELVVLSHVDGDHIIGLLDLFAALEQDKANGKPPRVQIDGLWHNAFQKTIDTDGSITQRMQMVMAVAGSKSIAMPMAADSFTVKDGNRLRIVAKKLKVPINKGFANDLIMVETATNAIKIGDLSLRVVGPTKANLDALRDKWLAWLSTVENQMASNPAALANSDKSVPNLSSIVLLAECDGKTILLTGDARSDHTLEGLKHAGLLNGGKLHVDILKVAHHGSNRNVTSTFFKKVTADKYVISANGKDDNPDLSTLEWIVEAAHAAGRKIEIIVTNSTPSTTKIKQSHKPADFGYKLTIKKKTDPSITTALA